MSGIEPGKYADSRRRLQAESGYSFDRDEARESAPLLGAGRGAAVTSGRLTETLTGDQESRRPGEQESRRAGEQESRRPGGIVAASSNPGLPPGLLPS